MLSAVKMPHACYNSNIKPPFVNKGVKALLMIINAGITLSAFHANVNQNGLIGTIWFQVGTI